MAQSSAQQQQQSSKAIASNLKVLLRLPMYVKPQLSVQELKQRIERCASVPASAQDLWIQDAPMTRGQLVDYKFAQDTVVRCNVSEHLVGKVKINTQLSAAEKQQRALEWYNSQSLKRLVLELPWLSPTADVAGPSSTVMDLKVWISSTINVPMTMLQLSFENKVLSLHNSQLSEYGLPKAGVILAELLPDADVAQVKSMFAVASLPTELMSSPLPVNLKDLAAWRKVQLAQPLQHLPPRMYELTTKKYDFSKCSHPKCSNKGNHNPTHRGLCTQHEEKLQTLMQTFTRENHIALPTSTMSHEQLYCEVLPSIDFWLQNSARVMDAGENVLQNAMNSACRVKLMALYKAVIILYRMHLEQNEGYISYFHNIILWALEQTPAVIPTVANHVIATMAVFGVVFSALIIANAAESASPLGKLLLGTGLLVGGVLAIAAEIVAAGVIAATWGAVVLHRWYKGTLPAPPPIQVKLNLTLDELELEQQI